MKLNSDTERLIKFSFNGKTEQQKEELKLVYLELLNSLYKQTEEGKPTEETKVEEPKEEPKIETESIQEEKESIQEETESIQEEEEKNE